MQSCCSKWSQRWDDAIRENGTCGEVEVGGGLYVGALHVGALGTFHERVAVSLESLRLRR